MFFCRKTPTPCLPLQDKNRIARAREIEELRKGGRWDWDYTILSPLPLLHEPCTDKPKWWHVVFGFFLGILPREEIPSAWYLFRRLSFRFIWYLVLIGTYPLWLRPRFETLEEYEQLFSNLTDGRVWNDLLGFVQGRLTGQAIPWCIENWRRDSAFAWQRVGGPNPMVIERFTTDKMIRLRDEHPEVAAWLAEQRLDQDNPPESRRLFVCDYEMLKTIRPERADPSRGQRRLPAPVAFLEVDSLGQLQPLAIYLREPLWGRQVVRPAAPPPPFHFDRSLRCFLPRSLISRSLPPEETEKRTLESLRWMVAKMMVQVADMNHHEMSSHLGRTHLFLETAAVAMHRALSTRHPLFHLLRPHFRFLIWNNFAGRELLINPGGYATQVLAAGSKGSIEIVRASYARWSFDKWHLKKELGARGVLDDASLPDFPYREDGLLVWDATEGFVKDYVDVYYAEDGTVERDDELKDFAKELMEDGRMRGLERPLTKEALVDMLTALIWTAGPQHSAVNYSQYNFMAYVPNQPGAIYGPEDSASLHPDSDQAAMKCMLKMLPPPLEARVQMYTIKLLTYYQYDRFGEYACSDFVDERVWPAIDRFREKLLGIGRTITERQANRRGLSRTYPYLIPQRIANSPSL